MQLTMFVIGIIVPMSNINRKIRRLLLHMAYSRRAKSAGGNPVSTDFTRGDRITHLNWPAPG